MEDLFNKLQKDGKNSVDNLIKWMSESNLIEVDSTKDKNYPNPSNGLESHLRTLFGESHDEDKVPLEEFKSVLTKIAQDQKKGIEELTQQLATDGPKVIKAALAGASAFKKEIMKDD